MISAVLIIALAISSQVDASWWSGKKNAADPLVPTRDQFLAQILATLDGVSAEIELSHQKISNLDNEQNANLARIDADVAEWASDWVEDIEHSTTMYARRGVDVSSCTNTFQQQLTDIKAAVARAAEKCVHDGVQDIADTVAKADTLVDKAESLLQRAQEEAAQPNGEYGKQVQAILKDAADLETKAKWNNAHIGAVLQGLKWCTDTAETVYVHGASKANKILGSASDCMRSKAN